MHPKYQEDYREIIAQQRSIIRRQGGDFKNIKPTLLARRDYLLQEESRRLKKKKLGDTVYVLSSTALNTAMPYSGLFLTVPYVAELCRSFSKDMGIVTSMKEDLANATGEAIYLEILKQVLKDAGLDEALHASVPILGVSILLMPIKWKLHRKHIKHMIDKILDKAMEYHESWIVKELKAQSS